MADKWCGFLECLPHVKGKWARHREDLELSDWQVFCTVNIFGWYWVEKEKRRFRDVYVEVPRKNGKTFWFAGIGLGMFTIDGEYGAEVLCGATSEAQAWEIFRPARLVCKRTPELTAKFGIEINAKTLVRVEDESRFVPIIGNPGDGASPHCGIADEYHEHRTADLVDTLETGMGARDEPLLLQITTAGADMGGPCYTKRMDVVQILNGTVDDDNVFGIIYTLDEGDEWDTVDAQIKANPNYGISVSADFLEGQLKQARRSPSKQSAYKTKHLNMWVGAKAAWMNMLALQACRKKNISLQDMEGERCVIGIDLASKIDIACMAILFPPGKYPKWRAFCKHYLPEDTIEDSDRYRGWHAGGWITSTPGNVIDYEYIEEDLKALRSTHEIAEVPFDPFQATQFSIRMLAEGFPMIEVGATVKNFSEPMKFLEALILQRKIEFDMDPVLHWCFGNCVAALDAKDNIYPRKERPENRIDPVVALIMAVNRCVTIEPEGPSVYETRGVISL
jgi:phage terminase large subunit-like protein